MKLKFQVKKDLDLLGVDFGKNSSACISSFKIFPTFSHFPKPRCLFYTACAQTVTNYRQSFSFLFVHPGCFAKALVSLMASCGGETRVILLFFSFQVVIKFLNDHTNAGELS